MNQPRPIYQIEKNEILRKAYQLLAYFLANRHIARLAHPDDQNEPLKVLENRFLKNEVSILLLEVAILFRSLDDQLKNSPDANELQIYLEKADIANKRYGFDMFDKLSIRKCCNKIIHATIFEMLETDGGGSHAKDYGAYYDYDKREIVWRHLSGDIRISGEYKNLRWVYLINVIEFVEAISYLLNDG